MEDVVTNTAPSEIVENTTFTYRPPHRDIDLAMTASMLFLAAIFGIVANIITILVLYQASSLRSIFNHYIMSLCVSDLVSAVISPLWAYRKIWGFHQWEIPHFFCKLYWGGDMTTSIATSLHIVAFSALRFLSVAKPHAFNRITLTHAKISIFCFWIVSIGVGFVPFTIFMGVTKFVRTVSNASKPSCSAVGKWIPTFKIFNAYTNILFFYIPLALIFAQSSATAFVICIRRSQRAKARKKRPHVRESEAEIHRKKKEIHAIIQLALIVGSYSIGYLPTTIFLALIPTLSASAKYDNRRIFVWWLGTLSFMGLRLSECLNPIFYNLASSKLRSETKKWLLKKCGREQVSPNVESRATVRTVEMSNISTAGENNAGRMEPMKKEDSL